MPHDLKRSRVLRFRVDDEEWGEIDLARVSLGFPTMSEYLRHAANVMAEAVNAATDDAAHDAWLMKLADAAFPPPAVAAPGVPEPAQSRRGSVIGFEPRRLIGGR